MTPKEVKEERWRITSAMEKVNHAASLEIKKLQREQVKLEKACPHPPEAAGRGPYCSWCADCGHVEDAT